MASISEKIVTVAENTPKVHHAGQLNVVQSAQSLKGSESNTAMLLDDVSPVTHEMGVKVRGKNLFNKSTLRTDSGTKNLTQINNGFTFQTNATKITMSVTCDIFLGAGTYYCRGTVSSSDGLNGGWGLFDHIKQVYIINASSRGTVNDKFTITESKTYRLSFFANYNSAAGVTMTFTNIQLELGTTATEYTPYIPDLTAVTVSRCGKNLFNQYADTQMVGPYRGIVITNLFKNIRKNGVLSVSLKEGSTFQQGLSFGLISNLKVGSGATAVWFQGENDTDFRLTHNKLSSMIYDDSRNYLIGIYPSTISNWNRIIDNYNIQIELGSTATDYEPYKECAEYTPTADGTVNGVTSLYPNTTLTTDTDGVIIDCGYYKDIDKAFNELSSAIALSGGE